MEEVRILPAFAKGTDGCLYVASFNDFDRLAEANAPRRPWKRMAVLRTLYNNGVVTNRDELYSIAGTPEVYYNRFTFRNGTSLGTAFADRKEFLLRFPSRFGHTLWEVIGTQQPMEMERVLERVPRRIFQRPPPAAPSAQPPATLSAQPPATPSA